MLHSKRKKKENKSLYKQFMIDIIWLNGDNLNPSVFVYLEADNALYIFQEKSNR